MNNEQTTLESFHRALADTPQAVHELTPMTYWRYVNGKFPKALDWLIRHPNLLRALAADAERERRAQSDN